MNQTILKYLKDYSYQVNDVNRLLVSSFLLINRIGEVENEFINTYIIHSKSAYEYDQLINFVNIIKKENKRFSIEDLIELFEFVISPADKEVNGAVYTPKNIREFIVKNTIKKYLQRGGNIEDAKFGDIACGCGGFFKTIVDRLRRQTQKSYFDIFNDNIYGVDIQVYSIERTKILLSLLAIVNGEDRRNFAFNLFQGDSLVFDWSLIEDVNNNNGFDIIVGNPPYIGASKIDNETKLLLKKWKTAKSGKADLYIPFFEIGMESLNANGVLGYITVNTFYKSLNGRLVREYFSKKEFDLSIIDFGGEQLFRRRSTYTCICIIGKAKSSSVKYLKTESKSISAIKKKDFISLKYSELDDFEGWYLNGDKVNEIISKIELTGKPLGESFVIRNGFATLKNNIYIFKPVRETKKYYCLEKDGVEYKVEKEICRKAIKPNTLKLESEIEDNSVKLIFPYNIIIEEKDLFDGQERTLKIIDERKFKKSFPFAYEYLLSQKEILAQRDKGTRQYEEWYAYGRNQALTLHGYKLLFPYISGSPCFVYTSDKDFLFYNGYAVLSQSEEDLLVLQKILMSKVFWYYIKNTSKPYAGNFFSFAKNYIKNFGVCDLSAHERNLLLEMNDKNLIDDFLLQKYDIVIDN